MTVDACRVTVAPPLQTRGLTVGYGRRRPCPVLTDISVTVRAGEFVCLLGANGTGKSTLLRTIARLQPALGGTIELGGTKLRSLTPTTLARRVGVVSTERVDVQALSARSVVELGRYPYSGWLGRLTARDREAVHWAAHAVHAAHLLDRDLSRLSDGERQRVMIARALAQEPVLLLLDEPTAFLDAPSRIGLIDLLRRLTREAGLGAVVSTHELDLALQAADTLWLVMPGGTVCAGTPEEVTRDGTLGRAFDGRPMRLSASDSRSHTSSTAEEERTDMSSISTMRGDTGHTSLAGGVRVSKASVRVEAYGTIDELNSTLGFARALCDDGEVATFVKAVQQDLFRIGSALATPPESAKPQVVIEATAVDRLTGEVHRLEAIEGILADWSIPGEHRAAAAFDMSRTVCRRAERAVVRLQESGADLQPAILAYVNRLSDVLWLVGRKLERDAGVSASLRETTGRAGNRFSRAWW